MFSVKYWALVAVLLIHSYLIQQNKMIDKILSNSTILDHQSSRWMVQHRMMHGFFFCCRAATRLSSANHFISTQGLIVSSPAGQRPESNGWA
ncbi:hypothetical protein BP00DRAFT_86278 [Aspergillus indologenus CBS 114.80]|uniref:Secreted protein n=1 Tax=Aspergillus indologenus CBS 114.80 TaxID=1450541 RepID=A0A2V5IZ34_9EURO|nr:hypothetical protein BP00DRAFT_86278 [Aspergillus indologenus CBS 114.80]